VRCYLFISDGEVLGHLGCIPARFWDGNHEHVGSWFNGFMVLPEHRNGPVGFSVLKEAIRKESLAAVLTVAEPSRRLFRALGFTDFGPVPNYLLLLRPGVVLRAIDFHNLGLGGSSRLASVLRLVQRTRTAPLIGALVGTGLAAWKFVRRLGIPGVVGIELTGSLPSSEELSGLWRSIRTRLAGAQVRDASYIEWRYAKGTDYEFSAARRNGELCGLAVVRRPRERSDERLAGLRVATVSDILFRPADVAAGVAALAGAERVARRMDADVLLCTASHAALVAALRHRAFVRLAGNVHFMLRDAATRDWPLALSDWWLTRGDADADGTF
jgi:hypothetical protein